MPNMARKTDKKPRMSLKKASSMIRKPISPMIKLKRLKAISLIPMAK